MAKKSTVARSNRTPKFKSRVVRRCFRCGRKRAFMRDFGMCRACFRGGKRRTDPGCPKIIMVTDPISDLLIRLKNASMAGKTQVSLPLSRMKLSIAEILEREGYVSDVESKAPKGTSIKNTLSLSLVYKNGRPAISGVKRISKPSRRMYMGTRELKPIMRGHGLLVLSTPAGILTGKEAKEKRVGGEALFEIW